MLSDVGLSSVDAFGQRQKIAGAADPVRIRLRAAAAPFRRAGKDGEKTGQCRERKKDDQKFLRFHGETSRSDGFPPYVPPQAGAIPAGPAELWAESILMS